MEEFPKASLQEQPPIEVVGENTAPETPVLIPETPAVVESQSLPVQNLETSVVQPVAAPQPMPEVAPLDLAIHGQVDDDTLQKLASQATAARHT